MSSMNVVERLALFSIFLGLLNTPIFPYDMMGNLKTLKESPSSSLNRKAERREENKFNSDF